MILSNSDRTCFKNCRRKWDLCSPNRQNWRAKKKSKPLWLGSLVHNCLEAFYGGTAPTILDAYVEQVKLIPKSEQLEFWDELQLAGIMVKHYGYMYPTLDCEDFDVLAVEMPFKIPLDDKGNFFAGTFDGVMRSHITGGIEILEHKTFSMVKDYRMHAIDDQTSIYPAALNLLIQEGAVPGTTKADFCDTVVYNGLWKKIPSELVALKNGSLAKKSYKVSTPQWIKNEIGTLPDNVKINVDFLEEIKDNVIRFFPRVRIFRGKDDQQAAVQRLMGEFREMNRKDLFLYHNPTTECSWKCSFVPVCAAMNSGVDVEDILKSSYEQAPSRGEAYTEED